MTGLKPIKPKTISDQVFEQIREQIYRGSLRPGAQLMTERELARTMAVSRSSIRNAIQRLVAMGLLVQRQGEGTFVKAFEATREDFLATAMDDPDISLENLLEVRMGLECNAAALAAERADDSDIAAMAAGIRQMQTEFEAGELATRADISFHMAIAFAARNPFQIWIMSSINDYLFHGSREALQKLYADENNIDRILVQHNDIFSPIKRRNPSRAAAAMEAHIRFLSGFLNRQ